jgi:predicted nucleic acid-binding protein
VTSAYFDTSALLPLIVEEAGSNEAKRLWRDSEYVISARVVYAEGYAALAAAARLVEVSDRLVRRAGALADEYSLRGYDSVHLAAAEFSQGDDSLVFVAGDNGLCTAAERIGLEVVRAGAGASASAGTGTGASASARGANG